jgi:tagatose 1,6-diphosphate aldolase
VIPTGTGILMALEATGYSGDPDARQSQILPGWSVEKSKRMSANAAKLLVYYHPDAPTAGFIEDLVKEVAAACEKADLPLFLEPLSYSLSPDKKKLSPDERHRVVIETARRLSPLGIDVLKAEFPLDIAAESDETAWRQACKELSQASVTPWVLLSAAVDIEIYLRQVATACHAGASGVAVGRAVWKEATEFKGQPRLDFLRGTAKDRMDRCAALCNALARPWTDFYSGGQVTAEWYSGY